MASRLLSRCASLQRRCFSSATGAGQELRDAILKEEAAAAETMKLWKKLSIFVVVPAIALTMYNAYLKEKEHMSHPRAEFVAYQHLRIRNKAFPWGDGNHGLIHNPHVNALPEGYETEDEHEHGHGDH